MYVFVSMYVYAVYNFNLICLANDEQLSNYNFSKIDIHLCKYVSVGVCVSFKFCAYAGVSVCIYICILYIYTIKWL